MSKPSDIIRKAESLYGAAPEGDEATGASQSVPDPGESRSYMSWPIASKLLNGSHLGRKIRVTEDDRVTQGILVGVRHWASVIEERPLCQAEPDYHLGPRGTVLRFAHGFLNVRPEALVELLD